jgi:hypothetical protein
MYPACEYSMRFAASALTWSGLPLDGLKGLHFGIAGREDVISAMLSEHGDLAGLLVCDSEGKPEKGVRAVGEPNKDALAGREVARREAFAILATPLSEILPQSPFPGFGNSGSHLRFRSLKRVE